MKPLLLALAVAFCGNAGAADPFAPANFAPAPAAVPPASPARVPVVKAAAPPLPFRYIGRLLQNGKAEVLLMRGERLYSIAAGERIGDDYLVERIGDASISFTYLPLNLKQSLDLPGIN
jgi:hypothetical protein